MGRRKNIYLNGKAIHVLKRRIQLDIKFRSFFLLFNLSFVIR